MELEQSGAELALKHLGDGLYREEPAGLFGSSPGVLRGESAPGDQAMQMGMVHEVLAPGMEDGRECGSCSILNSPRDSAILSVPGGGNENPRRPRAWIRSLC